MQAEANEERSQAANRAVAVFRLRLLLAVEIRYSDPRGPLPSPSQLWNDRCRKSKLPVSATNEHFPSLLAEALDVIHDAHLDIAAASKRLSISSTQLVNLLKLHPPALAWLNASRKAQSMHIIK